MKRFEQTDTAVVIDHLKGLAEPECAQLLEVEQTTRQLLDDLLGHHEDDDFPILTASLFTPEFHFEAED